MKTMKVIRKMLMVGVLAATAAVQAQVPLTPAFTYQGQLADGAGPVAGFVNMSFELYDAAAGGNLIAGPLPIANVAVENGAFTVQLDFGAAAFDGFRRWVDVTVNGDRMDPRQELTAVPYAMYSLTAPGGGGGGADGFWSPNGVNIHNNNAGNVGINTAAPAYPLHVEAAGYGMVQSAGGHQMGTYVSPGSGWCWLGTVTPDPLHFFTSNGGSSMVIDTTGNVGIGTTSPASRLEITGQDGLRLSGYQPFMTLNDTASGRRTFVQGVGGSLAVVTESRIGQPAPFFIHDASANIGMGDYYFNPVRQLHILDSDLFVARFEGAHTVASVVENRSNTSGAVWEWAVSGSASAFGLPAGSLYFYKQGNGNAGLSITPENFAVTMPCADFKMGHNTRRGAPGRALVDGGDTLVLNFANDWAKTRVDSLLQCKALEILGGADLAEPFDIAKSDTDMKVEPGMVVVIDSAKDGQLKVSSEAYDRTVAGIISGAGGINPGVTLKQEGSIADGSQNVALSGRVYCWVDADANGPVAHGDLLTTSNTPGHAMKVTDHGQATGAIIGKAMSRLDSGKGLVLVLVNLQ